MIMHLSSEHLALLKEKPHLFSFRQACEVLEFCDFDAHVDFIKQTILKYSVNIYGLPECTKEDTSLAVFFLFEDMFGVPIEFQLSVRYEDANGQYVVGVLFDTISTRQEVLYRVGFLANSQIRILPNDEIKWILDVFCYD